MLYRAGTRATDGLLKIFNKISEEYLYAFLAIDVVALWITRILKGLDRGKIVYDPTTDPEAQKMGPWEQLKYTWRKNLQGLNWANAREEAMREIFTGPFALLIPTFVYAYARKKYKGSAMQLGYPSMVELKNSYIDHLTQAGLKDATGKISPQKHTETLANFVVNLFEDPQSLHRKDPKFQQLQQMLKHRVEAAHPVTGKISSMEIRDYIRHWANAWAQKATECIAQPAKITGKSFDEMGKELKGVLIDQYNRKVMPHGATHSGEIMVRALQESPKENGKLVSKLKLQPLDDILTNLQHFKGYANNVYETHLKNPTSKLADVAEYCYQRLTRNKFIFAGIATFVASLYLFFLPRLVQSGGHYPANRLNQGNTTADNSAAKNNAKAPETRPSGTQKTIPSLTRSITKPLLPAYPPPPPPARFYPQPQHPFMLAYPPQQRPLPYTPYVEPPPYGGYQAW